MKLKTLSVPLGDRAYPISITSGDTLAEGENGLADSIEHTIGDCTHVVLIHDESVLTSAAQVVEKVVARTAERITKISVPSGETSKSIEQLSLLWNTMLESSTDRQSVVIAVGGGVVGDLAGFAAASFTRGIRFVQVPTTLLAMVDSSVGGKTGINLPGGKNMVGAFWQPHLVWIDTEFLSTLPARETISGLAEVIKYGVIEDAQFFDWLEEHADDIVAGESNCIREAVARSCLSKARVVAEDERETSGRRAILNYGHTFAHAIEANAGYGTMLHGEAVSIGMQMAAELALRLELCEADLLVRQTRLLSHVGLPMTWDQADPAKMLPVMSHDKKVAHGKLRFVLPRRIGHVELVSDVPCELVEASILACR